MRQAFDNLEPGGWFETQDFNCDSQSDDGTLLPDSALQRWFDDMNAASEIIHRPLSQAHLAKNWLAEVGFVDIHEKCYKIPLNGWAKDPRYKALGKLWEQNWMSGLSGWSMSLFTQVLGRTPEEVEVRLLLPGAPITPSVIRSADGTARSPWSMCERTSATPIFMPTKGSMLSTAGSRFLTRWQGIRATTK